MPGEVSDTMEEYLEAIFRLQERYGVARTGDIVAMLKVSPGTVTNTIDKLKKSSLIVHEPYRGVQLTGEGRRIAIGVIRRHRLLERLLTDLLGIEWYKVHEIACSLEHWVNDHIINKIERILGFPRTCPHGNPIPTENNEIFSEEAQSLMEVNVGERVVIARIDEEEFNLLRYLDRIGIRPEKSIEVIDKTPLNDLILIRLEGKIHPLSREVASSIMIRRPK